MKKDDPAISSDELVRNGTIPMVSEKETANFIPPSPKALLVIPPFLDKDDPSKDETVIGLSSRIQSTEVPPASGTRKKVRSFLGIRIPHKYDDMSLWQILITVFLSDRSICLFLSLLFHLSLFILLAMLVFQTRTGVRGIPINAEFADDGEAMEIIEQSGESPEAETFFESVIDKQDRDKDLPDAIIKTFAMNTEALPETAMTIVPESITPIQNNSGGGLPLLNRSGLTKGRTVENRKKGLPGREGDTTNASENAVEQGLAWLAEHQLPDGGWAFNLDARDTNDRTGTCQGRCSNTFKGLHHQAAYQTGLHPSRTAATALAILPFLGAGYTHLSNNKYQKTIHSGLEFLKYHTVHAENGYDFREGLIAQGMYIQGIVTLTFCEAWEMSQDVTLKSYAQEGIHFIEKAQREDGGWRYHTPQDTDFFKDTSGDMTITGWQILALKSAVSAGLEVKPSVIYMVNNFLRLVQNKDGSLYHYLPIKNESSIDKMWATTAVGLLLRQHLGWRADNPGLKRGIAYLREWLDLSEKDWQLVKKGQFTNGKRELLVGFGESNRKLFVYNIYFVFYAMLTLHNQGGSDWHLSFARVREFLIESQIQTGHERGSWLFHDLYMNDGGRLLNTALSILVLETPYRYLPMYSGGAPLM